MTDRPSLFGFAICASGATIIALGLLSRMVGLDPDTWTIGGLGLLVLLLIPASHWRGMFRAEREREAIDLAEKATRARLLAFQVEERERALAVVPVEAPDPYASDWKLALTTFFLAGENSGGFSIRRLYGVVGSESWELLTTFYRAAGVLVDLGGGRGTVWAEGWTIRRVRDELAAGLLPHPDGAPPQVTPYTVSATRHPVARQKTAARAVVDG